MTSALRVPGGALGLALAVGLGLVAYHFLAGSHHAASAAPARPGLTRRLTTTPATARSRRRRHQRRR
jgi:hypothetical protein